MKKGLLVLVAAGAFLMSCGGGNEEQAAKEYCDCYAEIAKATEEMTNAASATDMLSAAANMEQMANDAKECEAKWKEKYDGKINIDKFKEEVKKQNETVYNLAEKSGVF